MSTGRLRGDGDTTEPHRGTQPPGAVARAGHLRVAGGQ